MRFYVQGCERCECAQIVPRGAFIHEKLNKHICYDQDGYFDALLLAGAGSTTNRPDLSAFMIIPVNRS